MQITLNMMTALLAATAAARKQVDLRPFEGEDCNGENLGRDVSGDDTPLHYCFDISAAKSYKWYYRDITVADSDYAKFTYYTETGCSGDVTAVKVLCGLAAGFGTCYNKHDLDAGSVFVSTQGPDRGCDFWEEGEKECDPQGNESARPPPCDNRNFPDT